MHSVEEVQRIAAKEKRSGAESVLKKLLGESYDGKSDDAINKIKSILDSQKTDAEKQAEMLKNLQATNDTLAKENAELKSRRDRKSVV